MSTKKLREGSDILFADGDTRTIYPLTIRQLRRFMKAVKAMNTEGDENNMDDADISLMIEAVSIALEKTDPELAKDLDQLEDVVDIKSFNKVLAAAMGTDPNA